MELSSCAEKILKTPFHLGISFLKILLQYGKGESPFILTILKGNIREYAGNVMNTIPTTSNKVRVPYTIVGSKRNDKNLVLSPSLSLLVLNRGGRPFKIEYLKELQKLGPVGILSVEGSSPGYDIEILAKRFPGVQFLLFHRNVTVGEQINIGLKESSGRNVLVIWNDMKPGYFLSPRFLEHVEHSNVLCSVPVLQNNRLEIIPSVKAPAFYRRKLKILSLMPSSSLMESLYPFDYTGIYNKEKFFLTGGYDYTITSRYWQKLDFGFRAHMWGEKIVCNTSLKVQYLAENLPEDATYDESYRLFYLKNLSLRFSGDSAYLSKCKFLPYYFKSGSSFPGALRDFKSVRQWVTLHRYRFSCDALSITDLWEIPGE